MSEAAFVRRHRRRSHPAASVASRFFTILGGAVAAVLFLYLLAVIVVLPRLRISRIHVQADFEISRQELLELAGISDRTYYFSLSVQEITARLLEHPMIKTATVRKTFPDAVRMDLLRRRPVALIVYTREGRLVPAALDEEGVIYDAGPHLAHADLPLISGVEFQGNPLGSRMPEMLHGFLQSLYRLRLEDPRLFDRLSELKVVPRRNGGFDILMFTADYRIPVRLGSEITAEQSRWSLMILDVLAQQGAEREVAEVDFRSGEIIYRMKEEFHGR